MITQETKHTQQDLRRLEDRSFSTEWGTYDCYNHSAFYYNLSLYPFLDLYLKKLGLLPTIQWPGNKRFAVLLSHDVDFIGQYNWTEHSTLLRRLVRQKDRSSLIALLKGILRAPGIARANLMGSADPYHNFDAWMDLEAKYDAKSTFFFSTQVPFADQEIWDCAYDLQDSLRFRGQTQTVGELMKAVSASGWEVGIHPAIQSHTRPELLRAQKTQIETALGSSIQSIRQHFLMFNPERTPTTQSQAGFRFDSTYGFNKQVGFRAGTCLPFQFSGAPIWEIPLVLQDVSLLREVSAMGLGLEAGKSLIRQILRRVAEVGGVLTALWHPNNLNAGDPNYRLLYEFLLAEASAQGAWLASQGEIGQHFIQQPQVGQIQNIFRDLDLKDLRKYISCMELI